MKVKEYMVKRIEELEREKSDNLKCIEFLYDDIRKLKDKIEILELEREHIKEIITCNIGYDGYNHAELKINIGDNDFKTLLAILDIKPEDYKPQQRVCRNCKYQLLEGTKEPCYSCNGFTNWIPKEVTENAETED